MNASILSAILNLRVDALVVSRKFLASFTTLLIEGELGPEFSLYFFISLALAIDLASFS